MILGPVRLEYFMREVTFDSEVVVRRLLVASQGGLISSTDRKWIYEGSLGIHLHSCVVFFSYLFIQSKERGREQCENTAWYRHGKMFVRDLIQPGLELLQGWGIHNWYEHFQITRPLLKANRFRLISAASSQLRDLLACFRELVLYFVFFLFKQTNKQKDSVHT